MICVVLKFSVRNVDAVISYNICKFSVKTDTVNIQIVTNILLHPTYSTTVQVPKISMEHYLTLSHTVTFTRLVIEYRGAKCVANLTS